MTPTAPTASTARSRVVDLARVTVIAALALHATCDTQDLSGELILELASGDEAVVRGLEQDGVGRVAIDYGLVNTGDEVGIFDVTAQAQTSGVAELAACEELAAGDPRPLTAAGVSSSGIAEGQSIPTLRTLDRAHVVGVSTEFDAAAIDLRIRSAGTYRLYSTQRLEFSLVDADGEAQTLTTGASAGCALAASLSTFTVNDGTFRLSWPAEATTLLLEADCADVRNVPRTCPGTFGPEISVGSQVLLPGEVVSGRINASELGVGDRVVVALACSPLSPDCAGRLSTYLVVEPLDCQADSDCRASESCDDGGYCLTTASGGCAAAPIGGPGGAFAALGVALVVARRRWTRASLTVALLLALAAPPAEAEPPRVTFTPGLRTSAFTGELGRQSSASIGVSATQGVRLGSLELQLGAGTDYRLTHQPEPPFEHGLQTYEISVAAGAHVPLSLLDTLFSAEYVSLGLISNPLTALTGSRLRYDGVGARVAARVDLARPLFGEVSGFVRTFPAMRRPSTWIGLTVAVGLAGPD
ncbi:MAG: hypothetical protein H6700_05840 [Myxococcales bacterium]|nr:hypothetical protein [Myxococcales bacterium]MCB9531268.1 hypothetical protein [Myxococcales bacterium]